MSEAPQDATAPLIVCLGELLWDVLPDGAVLGGAPANVAVRARRLGARTAMISAVGDDPPGRRARQQLDRLGVDTSGVSIVPDQPTGTVAVTVAEDGEPAYRIAEPAAWDFIPQSPEAFGWAASADALCYGTLAQRGRVSRTSIAALIDAAPPRALRVLDVNLRHPWVVPDLVVVLLERSNVVKLNESELAAVAEFLGLAGGEGALLEQLAERYRQRLVALTRGRSGCHLYADRQHVEHDGFSVDAIVDSVGAGDAFTAALITGVWRGLPLKAVAECANRVASQVCCQSGASQAIGDIP